MRSTLQADNTNNVPTPPQNFSHNVPRAGQIYSYQGNNLNNTIHEANNLGSSLGNNMESSAGSLHADGNNGDWSFNWTCIQAFADKHKRFIVGIVKISTVLITIGVSSTSIGLGYQVVGIESAVSQVIARGKFLVFYGVRYPTDDGADGLGPALLGTPRKCLAQVLHS